MSTGPFLYSNVQAQKNRDQKLAEHAQLAELSEHPVLSSCLDFEGEPFLPEKAEIALSSLWLGSSEIFIIATSGRLIPSSRPIL